jgi:cytochrome b6
MMEHKSVPVHSLSWGYYTGGLTMLFLVIQIATGLLLLFYYQPTVTDANLSVEYITNNVSTGALLRNMHTWSSSAMVLFALIHLLATFAMKAFDKPRELTWLSGVCLLIVTFAFAFTGYLLPWNQLAVNATKVVFQAIDAVGQYLPGSLAQLPHFLRETFQGEAALGQSTLSRFYALHVVILPFALTAILAFHLIAVQLHGMSQGVDKPSERTEKFVPIFFLKDLSVWTSAFLILAVVSLTVPFDSFLSFPLLRPYNALQATPPGIKPEWYFYFLYYPLELLPFWLVLLGTFVAVSLLVLAPWIFRSTSRRTLQVMALCASAYLFTITVFGQQIYDLLKKQ